MPRRHQGPRGTAVQRRAPPTAWRDDCAELDGYPTAAVRHDPCTGEFLGDARPGPQWLRTGQRLDRFGSEHGGYLAPAGDAYEERALPPQNLNTPDADVPCDYRVYKVAKPFWVWQGSIAPWVEQSGGGQQIKLDAVFLGPGEGQRLNVKWLLDHDYLTPAGG
ncbi:TNT domain-containing protein [Streptomyces sp. NPDC002125]